VKRRHLVRFPDLVGVVGVQLVAAGDPAQVSGRPG
jgi:hypothetical protein